MARNKVILVDADVLSHFIVTGNIDDLTKILSPHTIYIVENVYQEAIYHPTDSNRKNTVDSWMERCNVKKIKFAENNPSVMKEYFRLKKQSPLFGSGERACMAMARFGHEVIASSNFRDVAEYCDEFDIEYIGVLDILMIAKHKGYYNEEKCDHFIQEAKDKNKARFPVDKISLYSIRFDLNSF